MAFGTENSSRNGIYKCMETFRRRPWVANKANIVTLCCSLSRESGRDSELAPPAPNRGKSPSQRLAIVEEVRSAVSRYRRREWASDQAKLDCDRLLSIIGYPGDELPAIFRQDD